MCPTNDDPEFDNRPRVKRTTGIPRSFLQKVDKSVILAQTEGDESKRPSGIMVNSEGDFVIAEPDKASWEQFQAKAKTSSTTKTASAEDKEVQERGLECSFDKKMFVDPMKTPCCKNTYCNDCITDALIQSDFTCPTCQTEPVLLDDLQPDEETAKKIQEYLKEKESAKSPPASPKAGAEKSEDKQDQGPNSQSEVPADDDKSETVPEEAPQTDEAKEKSKSPIPQVASVTSPPTGPKSLANALQIGPPVDEVAKPDAPNLKKRPAEDFLENPKIPKGPKAMQNQQAQNMMPNMMNGMPGMNMDMNMMYGMNMMPNMMGMGNMNMNMGMPMMGMNPMMGMPGYGMNSGFGGMNGWDMNGMNGMGGGMGGMNGGNMGMNGGGMNAGMNPGMSGNMNGSMNGNMNGGMGGGMNAYQNRPNFSQPGNEEDAYFRKPVNPHRHQNKHRRVRPSDYREV